MRSIMFKKQQKKQHFHGLQTELHALRILECLLALKFAHQKYTIEIQSYYFSD